MKCINTTRIGNDPFTDYSLTPNRRDEALKELKAFKRGKADLFSWLGARLCEPQRVDGSLTRKFVPTLVLPATRCGSQTRAPAETGDRSPHSQTAFGRKTATSGGSAPEPRPDHFLTPNQTVNTIILGTDPLKFKKPCPRTEMIKRAVTISIKVVFFMSFLPRPSRPNPFQYFRLSVRLRRQ